MIVKVALQLDTRDKPGASVRSIREQHPIALRLLPALVAKNQTQFSLALLVNNGTLMGQAAQIRHLLPNGLGVRFGRSDGDLDESRAEARS
jgi:hypothetical protein